MPAARCAAAGCGRSSPPPRAVVQVVRALRRRCGDPRQPLPAALGEALGKLLRCRGFGGWRAADRPLTGAARAEASERVLVSGRSASGAVQTAGAMRVRYRGIHARAAFLLWPFGLGGLRWTTSVARGDIGISSGAWGADEFLGNRIRLSCHRCRGGLIAPHRPRPSGRTGPHAAARQASPATPTGNLSESRTTAESRQVSGASLSRTPRPRPPSGRSQPPPSSPAPPAHAGSSPRTR